jgi:hypothetical protein
VRYRGVEFEGPLMIVIDIRWRRDTPNRISPNSTNNINRALLSGDGFDATMVDPSTVASAVPALRPRTTALALLSRLTLKSTELLRRSNGKRV